MLRSKSRIYFQKYLPNIKFLENSQPYSETMTYESVPNESESRQHRGYCVFRNPLLLSSAELIQTVPFSHVSTVLEVPLRDSHKHM